MKKIGIYKITNPLNKVYIGQTKDFQSRLIHYKRKNCKRQQKLYNSIKKYGWNLHKMSLLEECLEENLNCRERFWQDHYDVLNREKGLNLILQQCDDNVKVLSEASKKATIESLKRYAKEKEDYIYQYDLNGTFLKKWLNLTDIKENSIFIPSYIAECYLNKRLKAYEFLWTKKETLFTEEFLTKAKVTKSDKLKGHKFNLGRVLTQEHKNKIGIKSKGFKHSLESIELISISKFKPIIQYDKNMNFIKNWNSAKNAAEVLKINPQNISNCCKNKLKTAGGYIWKYKLIINNN